MEKNKLTQQHDQECTNPSCFFCTMVIEPNPSLKTLKLIQCFKEMPQTNDQDLVLSLSGLWNIAKTQPNNQEFPSLGVFESMAKLIHKALSDKKWLLSHQNIYIPYYAAHIIGSYTMNKADLAEKAVKSGVVLPLIELLRGKITWVEQRVAIRALGHIASHNRTFEAIAEYESEVIELTIKIASTCFDKVYENFIGVKDSNRLKYHSNLLTRGFGGLETENRKAEEWASQLQCWSIYLLNCFACRERSLNQICNKDFLKELCKMWGGLVNTNSPCGIGLIRTLCNSSIGRRSIASIGQVIETLGNNSRSSDDWKFMGIESLLLLLKDPETRYKVIDIAILFLADLVELSLPKEPKVGERITQMLLQDYHKIKYGNLRLKSKEAERVLEEIWDLKVDRKKRDKLMSVQELKEKKLLVKKLKKEGNEKFWLGKFEKGLKNYSEALDLCPLKAKKERIILHSNRAQCYLVMREPELAISDTTRALCLSSAVSPHGKSLWRRSQAYDMKGLAKESLMDCLLFVKDRIKSKKSRDVRIPYYAARMINKQMNETWLFASASSRTYEKGEHKVSKFNSQYDVDKGIMKLMSFNLKHRKNKPILAKPLFEKQWRRRKSQKAGTSGKGTNVKKIEESPYV